MKKIILSLLTLFTINIGGYSQYTETFDLANRGILSGTCLTNDPASCVSSNFTDVTWTIEGDLSGIDSEGFFTKSGYLHAEDLDEEVCWVSPSIDIIFTATSDFNIQFTIPTGTTWDNSGTLGSADYMDVKYSVDGGAFITLANVNGCPGSGHTLSGVGCGSITGPQTFIISETGIVGAVLDIQVCIDTNGASDDGFLEEVSVPSGIILPVTWAGVDATNTPRGNFIEWSTSSEINNEKFLIQKRTNKKNEYTTIGTVYSNGNSTSINSYEYMDEKMDVGSLCYYRIKQVDYDGQYAYSKVVSIKNKNTFNTDIDLHPNPVTESLIISLKDNSSADINSLLIYNMYGKVVEQITSPFLDKSSLIYDASLLSAGMYYIKPMKTNGMFMDNTIRFIKAE